MRGREGLNSKLGFTRKTSYISKMREWESVGTWLRHQAMLLVYIGCVPLLCQGSKCMAYNGKSVWLAFRRSWVQILAGYQIFFFRGFTSHSLSKKISLAIQRHFFDIVVVFLIHCWIMHDTRCTGTLYEINMGKNSSDHLKSLYVLLLFLGIFQYV